MPRCRHTVEQILVKLREDEVALSKGKPGAQVCRTLGITEHTYHHWHSEYDGLKIHQAKRLKELERENSRLKQAVAELTLDTFIPKEAADAAPVLIPVLKDRLALNLLPRRLSAPDHWAGGRGSCLCLDRGLHESDPIVIESATEALEAIGTPEALKAIDPLLKEKAS